MLRNRDVILKDLDALESAAEYPILRHCMLGEPRRVANHAARAALARGIVGHYVAKSKWGMTDEN